MDKVLNSPEEPKVNGSVVWHGGEPSGLTLADYAKALDLPLAALEVLGLRTIANPWIDGVNAVGIPYRRRDGALFRWRIRQCARGHDGKRSRTLWDRREEKLGGLLYGLDQLPAKGCPLLLVDDEALCHLLWHHGFDAIGIAGPEAYFPKRDDAELGDFAITVLVPSEAPRREALLQRLMRSKHRQRMTVAMLDGDGDLIDLHRDGNAQFAETLNAAIASARPLADVAPATEPRAQGGASHGNGSANLEGTIADNLVTLAQRDGAFFASEDGATWADVTIDGRRETWSLKSRGFRNWLVHRYYSATGRAPAPDSLNQALLTLDASARYDGERHIVRVRTGALGHKYYVDLADEQWRAIEIDSEGWRIVTRPPIRFHRPRGMLPLPEPVHGGSLDELRELLNLGSANDYTLIIAWLLAALRPMGPYPLLAIAGEPGASKSTTARVLRGLTDPNVSCLRSAPREERDCWIAAGNSGMLAFDNLSNIPGWLSDALCRIATGGGYATRQLHTDDDEILFDAVRPTMLTSVSDVIARSDLADRAILIELPPIPEERRRPEEEFNAAFEAARPRILGALLDAMVLGLRRRSATTMLKLPRLADFAVWASACETAFTAEGGVMAAYAENHNDTVNSVLEGDAVCVALLKFLESHAPGQDYCVWKGQPDALLAALGLHAPVGALRGGWPTNPQALSGRLRMAARNLAHIGVQIERGRTKAGRFLRIVKSAPPTAPNDG